MFMNITSDEGKTLQSCQVWILTLISFVFQTLTNGGKKIKIPSHRHQNVSEGYTEINGDNEKFSLYLSSYSAFSWPVYWMKCALPVLVTW